jgi:hypothetical protein
MHHVLTILDGTSNVLKLLSSSVMRLGDIMNIDCSVCFTIEAEFGQISADLESHRLAAKRILAISKDLILVVSITNYSISGLCLIRTIYRTRMY